MKDIFTYPNNPLYNYTIPEYYSIIHDADELEAGTDYVINEPGDTDFTLVGAADSNSGTYFTATGPGTGTGTAGIRSETHGIFGRINELRNGNYKPNLGLPHTWGVTGTIAEVGRFINKINNEKLLQNLCMYDLWWNPLVFINKELNETTINLAEGPYNDFNTSGNTNLITTSATHYMTDDFKVRLSGFNNSWSSLNGQDLYVDRVDPDNMILCWDQALTEPVEFYQIGQASITSATAPAQIGGDPKEKPVITTSSNHGLYDNEPVTLSGMNGIWNDLGYDNGDQVFYVKVLTNNTLELYYDAGLVYPVYFQGQETGVTLDEFRMDTSASGVKVNLGSRTDRDGYSITFTSVSRNCQSVNGNTYYLSQITPGGSEYVLCENTTKTDKLLPTEVFNTGTPDTISLTIQDDTNPGILESSSSLADEELYFIYKSATQSGFLTNNNRYYLKRTANSLEYEVYFDQARTLPLNFDTTRTQNVISLDPTYSNGTGVTITLDTNNYVSGAPIDINTVSLNGQNLVSTVYTSPVSGNEYQLYKDSGLTIPVTGDDYLDGTNSVGSTIRSYEIDVDKIAKEGLLFHNFSGLMLTSNENLQSKHQSFQFIDDYVPGSINQTLSWNFKSATYDLTDGEIYLFNEVNDVYGNYFRAGFPGVANVDHTSENLDAGFDGIQSKDSAWGPAGVDWLQLQNFNLGNDLSAFVEKEYDSTGTVILNDPWNHPDTFGLVGVNCTLNGTSEGVVNFVIAENELANIKIKPRKTPTYTYPYYREVSYVLGRDSITDWGDYIRLQDSGYLHQSNRPLVKLTNDSGDHLVYDILPNTIVQTNDISIWRSFFTTTDTRLPLNNFTRAKFYTETASPYNTAPNVKQWIIGRFDNPAVDSTNTSFAIAFSNQSNTTNYWNNAWENSGSITPSDISAYTSVDRGINNFYVTGLDVRPPSNAPTSTSTFDFNDAFGIFNPPISYGQYPPTPYNSFDGDFNLGGLIVYPEPSQYQLPRRYPQIENVNDIAQISLKIPKYQRHTLAGCQDLRARVEDVAGNDVFPETDTTDRLTGMIPYYPNYNSSDNTINPYFKYFNNGDKITIGNGTYMMIKTFESFDASRPAPGSSFTYYHTFDFVYTVDGDASNHIIERDQYCEVWNLINITADTTGKIVASQYNTGPDWTNYQSQIYIAEQNISNNAIFDLTNPSLTRQIGSQVSGGTYAYNWDHVASTRGWGYSGTVDLKPLDTGTVNITRELFPDNNNITVEPFDAGTVVATVGGATLTASTQGQIDEVYDTTTDGKTVAVNNYSDATTGTISPSPDNPAPYYADDFTIVLPGSRVFDYYDAGGSIAYGVNVPNSEWWEPGKKSRTFTDTAGGEIGASGISASLDANGRLSGFSLGDSFARGRYKNGGYNYDMAVNMYDFSDINPPAADTSWIATQDQWDDYGTDKNKKWPTHLAPKNITINYNIPGSFTNTSTGIKYVQPTGRAKWTLEVEYPPMTKEQFAPFNAIAHAAKGQANPFYFYIKYTNKIVWDYATDPTLTILRYREDTAINDRVLIAEGFPTIFGEGADELLVKAGEVIACDNNINGGLNTIIVDQYPNVYGEAKIYLANELENAHITGETFDKVPEKCVVTLGDDNFNYEIDEAGFVYLTVRFNLDKFVD